MPNRRKPSFFEVTRRAREPIDWPRMIGAALILLVAGIALQWFMTPAPTPVISQKMPQPPVAAAPAVAPDRPDALDQEIADTAAAGQAASDAALTAPKQRGDECLDPWTGVVPTFVDLVKAKLADPDSFAHVETRVYPVSTKGMRTVVMRFRARNGFNAVRPGVASGAIDPRDCRAELDQIRAL